MLHACTVAHNNPKSLVIVSEISYDHVSAESTVQNLVSNVKSSIYRGVQKSKNHIFP